MHAPSLLQHRSTQTANGADTPLHNKRHRASLTQAVGFCALGQSVRADLGNTAPSVIRLSKATAPATTRQSVRMRLGLETVPNECNHGAVGSGTLITNQQWQALKTNRLGQAGNAGSQLFRG